jgi:hypothetical protein
MMVQPEQALLRIAQGGAPKEAAREVSGAQVYGPIFFKGQSNEL